MKLARTILAVAVGALVPLVPTAAHANRYTHEDGTGDVFSAPYNSTAFTPAPDRAVGDVVSSSIQHKRRVVVMQLRYLDLEPSSEFNGHVFVIRTPTMRRIVALVATSAFPNGRAQMTKPNRKKVTCHIPHRIDYSLNTATVAVPRSCLGNPRWVRVGMAGTSFTGFTGADTMWFDDALGSGTQGIYSPRVFR